MEFIQKSRKDNFIAKESIHDGLHEKPYSGMHRTRHDESRFARHAGFAALSWHFAVRVLQRLKVSAVQRHCLLGVTDPPQAINFCSAERIAADLVFEARRTEAPGVFADFEHDTPLNRRLLAAFDEALYDADIPLYVPLECGRTLSHRDTHGLHRDFGRQSDRVHFLPCRAFTALRGLPRFCSRFRRISPCRHPRRTAFHSVPQQEPRCSRRPAHSRSFRASCARNTSPT